MRGCGLWIVGFTPAPYRLDAGWQSPNRAALPATPRIHRLFQRFKAAFAAMLCDCRDGEPGGGKRCLQVVSAGRSVDIEHLARKIEARAFFRFHRPGIDLVEAHATNRHHRLLDRPWTYWTHFFGLSSFDVDVQQHIFQIAPGNDAAQFKQLGFEAGDLVTGINGIALDDPANTMRLYQAMRTASEAVFEITRGNQPVSLSVSLDAGAVDQ